MKLDELFRNNPSITLAVSMNDLKEWHQEVIKDAKMQLEQSVMDTKVDIHISPKKAAEIFDVDQSTLWRWSKRGYLTPVQIGGKRRYRMKDINNIMNGGKSDEK
ncbi:helix-turn-helix domain-containing protein [Parabacteroides sp. PF5-6]|uniref:helix-turn-helix domain-containing protein n=1 Tax=Parabacteroides sp. PF5-6 TaxID=1742403 RepID=UPI0024060233|nr:helix-turn-helix domain-containing protein [Parabacteroides sp. PF5-6]MDF9829337.1 hypothetical protein [Parabacteroides sp. PF5-6]